MPRRKKGPSQSVTGYAESYDEFWISSWSERWRPVSGQVGEEKKLRKNHGHFARQILRNFVTGCLEGAKLQKIKIFMFLTFSDPKSSLVIFITKSTKFDQIGIKKLN